MSAQVSTCSHVVISLSIFEGDKGLFLADQIGVSYSSVIDQGDDIADFGHGVFCINIGTAHNFAEVTCPESPLGASWLNGCVDDHLED